MVFLGFWLTSCISISWIGGVSRTRREDGGRREFCFFGFFDGVVFDDLDSSLRMKYRGVSRVGR